MSKHWIIEMATGLAIMLAAHHGFNLLDRYELKNWRGWAYSTPFILLAWILIDFYRRIPQ